MTTPAASIGPADLLIRAEAASRQAAACGTRFKPRDWNDLFGNKPKNAVS